MAPPSATAPPSKASMTTNNNATNKNTNNITASNNSNNNNSNNNNTTSSSSSSKHHHHSLNEALFRQKIHSALNQVSTLLNINPNNPSSPIRQPVYFAEYLNHTYNDKFGLAEFLTNVAIASQMNVLDVLGVDEETFQWMYGIATAGSTASSTGAASATASAGTTPSKNLTSSLSSSMRRRGSFASLGSLSSAGGLGGSFTSNSIAAAAAATAAAAAATTTQKQNNTTPPKKKSKYNRVILRFSSEETCSFHREEQVSVENAHYSTTNVVMPDHSEHGGGGDDYGNKHSSDDHHHHHQSSRQTHTHHNSTQSNAPPHSHASPHPKRKEGKQMFFRKASQRDKVTEYHWKVTINYSIQVLAASVVEGESDGAATGGSSSGGGGSGSGSTNIGRSASTGNINSSSNNNNNMTNNSNNTMAGKNTNATATANGAKRNAFDNEISSRTGDQVYLPSSLSRVSTSSSSEQPPPPPPKPITLQSRTATTEIITTANSTCPLPAKTIRPPIDVDLTWLFQHISSEDFNCSFTIHRTHPECCTPRRNKDCNEAMRYFTSVAQWCDRVCAYFMKGTAWNVDLAFGGNNHQAGLLGEGSNGGSGGGGKGGVGVVGAVSLESINAGSVFIPVLPLFEPPLSGSRRRRRRSSLLNDTATEMNGSGTTTANQNDGSTSPLLPINDVRLFLNEQCRTLDEKIGEVASNFPPPDSTTKLVTSSEAQLVLLACHAASITEYFLDGLQSIEEVMKNSLAKAIGDELTERDFTEYCQFHDKKLLKKEYAPKPFCRAIRRPKRFPEGSIVIESVVNRGGKGVGSGGGGGNGVDRAGWMAPVARNVWSENQNQDEKEEEGDVGGPIMTLVREVKWEPNKSSNEDGEEKNDCNASGMKIPITDLTSAYVSGKCYLHGWISQQFEGRYYHHHQLVAKARQFSSFLLMIGSITAPRCFEPKDAIIVQNKDEVFVPLILGMVPTSNEFDGLISSLSPEQQSFAQSARDTQFSSSVFGICVIEIRPQLEVLLGLPENSLTKEVRLTEHLVSLFVDHQIPSDMLVYDGPSAASTKEKLESVKENVNSAQEMAKEYVVDNFHDHHDETVSAELTADVVEDLPSQRPAFKQRIPVEENKRRQSQFSLFPDLSFDQGTTSIQADRPTLSSDESKGPEREISAKTPVEEVVIGDDEFAIEPEPHARVKRVPSIQYLESMTKDETEALISIPGKIHAKSIALDKKDDETVCLRPTMIHTADIWSKRTLGKPPIYAKYEDLKLGKAERKSEKQKALDLLDALSCSGSMPILFSELHAIVGVTHCFDGSLVDTVIVDNVDPIDKLSCSTLLVASAIHGLPTNDLLQEQNPKE